MTYYDIQLSLIESIKRTGGVNTIILEDVYKINGVVPVYPAIAITLLSATTLNNSIVYKIALTYIDRKINESAIVYSSGISAIYSVLDEIPEYSMIDITPFVYKFKDECTGVICTLTITGEINKCSAENINEDIKIV